MVSVSNCLGPSRPLAIASGLAGPVSRVRPQMSHPSVIVGCMTVCPGFDNRISLLASRQASAFSRHQVLAAAQPTR
jgi:hypothetical protein